MKNNKTFNSFKDIIEFVVGLAILILIGYLLIRISIYFIGALKVLFEKYTTIAVALVTGFLAFISTIIAKVVEHKFSINNQIRNERQEIYVEFLDWIINSLLYGNIKDNDTLVNDIRKYQKLMTIYGSDKVLKAWSEFKFVAINTILNKNDIPKNERMTIYINKEAIYLEKLLLAIRKDLGYRNRNIKQFDILKLYIDDINKYL